MAIIAELATVGLAATSGGLLGFAGSAFNRVAGFFENRQAFRQEQEKWKNDILLREHEVVLYDLNQKARAQETEQELEIITRQGSRDGLIISMKNEAMAARHDASKWVVNTLRLVRPVLTLFLLIMTGWIFKQIGDETIRAEVMSAIIFAASTAVFWWFGDRAPKGKKYA